MAGNFCIFLKNCFKKRSENVGSSKESLVVDPELDIKSLEYKGVKFEFRRCPCGSYTMGSPEKEVWRCDDEIQRVVTFTDDFWIGATPVTQAQWEVTGVEKKTKCRFTGTLLPVENVSYNECVVFIERLNAFGIAPEGWRFEIPTEEQWEYACRAGTSGSNYGIPLKKCAWYYNNSGCKTHEVGKKAPNKWGIYDMLGNVWEWTRSPYKEDGTSLVNRGGSWLDPRWLCRVALRFHNDPAVCADNLGFRLVLVRLLRQVSR